MARNHSLRDKTMDAQSLKGHFMLSMGVMLLGVAFLIGGVMYKSSHKQKCMPTPLEVAIKGRMISAQQGQSGDQLLILSEQELLILDTCQNQVKKRVIFNTSKGNES